MASSSPLHVPAPIDSATVAAPSPVQASGGNRLFGLAPKLLLFIAVATFGAVGLLTFTAIGKLRDALAAEYQSKGSAIAQSLAAGMEQTVGQDISTIQGAVDSNKRIAAVCYIYIQDTDGSILVHTFSPNFPAGLEGTNVIDPEKVSRENPISVNPKVDWKDATCREGKKGSSLRAMDIAAPISGGALGVVHVGMDRNDIDSHVSALRNSMLGFGSIFGALGLLVSMFAILGLVIRPIGELTRVTGHIVERGDLSQQIKVSSADEIGELASSFRRMVEKLRAIPVTLKTSVGELSQAVTDLTDNTRIQTTVVQRQASGLSEASATTQEIKQTSTLAAAKAEVVLKVATRAEEFSGAGQKAVESSIGGLQDIQKQIESIVERIADLSERTLQVGEIIESVKDLADQSNVLALNAAIEAAKAGEFGKGFAVVAREIRSLADQSIQSTGRIREILSEIQGAIRSTVAITDEGKKRMEQSMDEIRSSGENLREMSAIVQETSQAARQIAASVNQQNAGISQISAAITSMNSAMEETVGAIRGAETAATNLKAVSTTISGLVDEFQV